MAASQGPPEDIHSGTEHLAINNTFIRRWLTRVAIRILAKFYTQEGDYIQISKHKIVKTGRGVRLEEAATLQFLAEQQIVPVPKVYCSFVHKNKGYIVMEKIQGEELSKIWKQMSRESRNDVFDQLKMMFRELRELPPPGTAVESCIGGPLYDPRLSSSGPSGPFSTIQKFHRSLRKGLERSWLENREKNDDWYDIRDMMDRQDGPWPPPRLTHGDLNPTNIIINEGIVTGVVGWEFSGWFPYYWEYTSAWFNNADRAEWQMSLSKVLDPPQHEDYRMELIRHRWWSG